MVDDATQMLRESHGTEITKCIIISTEIMRIIYVTKYISLMKIWMRAMYIRLSVLHMKIIYLFMKIWYFTII